jgi:hypothetical protein
MEGRSIYIVGTIRFLKRYFIPIETECRLVRHYRKSESTSRDFAYQKEQSFLSLTKEQDSLHEEALVSLL